VNRLFKILLAIWTIGFLITAVVPLVTGNAVAGGIGPVVGAILFVPWLVGAVILGMCIWLTGPPRR